MKSSLYIITHKEIENEFPKCRKIMMVGAYNKEVPNGYFSDYDENLPNISNKNSNYCELTGLYYFINNDLDADIMGLEHYRRLFIKREFYFFNQPYLKIRDVKKILKKYDVIVPIKEKFETTIKEHYQKFHYISDLEEVGRIIQEKCPEYSQSFEEIINQNETYSYNMFITKKDIAKSYANWLFEILFELEKRIDISKRDTYQKRVFGFLSERLFTVWLNKNNNLKRKEIKVYFISPETKTTLKTRIKRVLFKIKLKLKRNTSK